MSFLVVHPTEVEDWQRLLQGAGMTLQQLDEEVPLKAESIPLYRWYQVKPAPALRNRAGRRARAKEKNHA